MSPARTRKSRQPGWLYRRIHRIAFVILSVGFLLGLPLIFLFFPSNDHLDQQWVSCQVESATVEQLSDDESWRVVLESPDCPVMFIADGVQENNAQPIASAVVPGLYDLRVHENVLESDGAMRVRAPVEVHAHMLVQDIN